jgi:altronate dehydratase
MSMKGFDHGNRGIGIRNHQLILPSVVCSTRVSSRIAKETMLGELLIFLQLSQIIQM